jgi:UDP-N-acetylmuramoyl-L-alanyl-D-glutamate--2,6-diaminopimelate ligase
MTIRPAKIRTSLSELSRLVSGNCVGEIEILGISHDSREIQPGDLYVALPGANNHGAEFIEQAITNGAVAVASDAHGTAIAKRLGLPTIELDDPRISMAHFAARIYGHPEKNLSITGVTGTNGKTTTTHMLRSIFLDAGHHVGVIGTLGTYIDEECIPGARTTPESTDLFALLAVMVERGITHVFMEVSSHALALHRVVGLKFQVAIFTNLTQDHLDFHGSMENYFAAKAKLFTPEYSESAVICIDDSWGQKLFSKIEIPAITIGKNGDWVASDAISNANGMTLQNLQLPNGESIALKVNMLGTYNATNAACALAASDILGNPIAASLKALEHIRAIPGRLEKIAISSAGTAIVDYAHTPDAVATVLTVIRDASPQKVITVIGCGGDRDSLKRPLMGKMAAQLSDVVIVTDDNPRSEKPSDIRAAVLAGTVTGSAQVIEIGDRRQAISQALRMAQAGDVVAVLGKGHETGQEIAGEVFPFDDRLVVAQESANV